MRNISALIKKASTFIVIYTIIKGGRISSVNDVLSDGERETGREKKAKEREGESTCVCNECAVCDIVQPGAKPQCGLLKLRTAPENGVCP